MPFTSQVNGTSVDIRITEKVLETYLQGDSERDNKGVYSSYTKEEAVSQIRVPKPDLLPILPRRLGASVNGGSFSGSALQVTNSEYLLEVLDVVDTNIDVPFNNLSLVPQLKIDDWSKQIGKGVYLVKNGMCLATKFFQSFYNDSANANVVTYTAGQADGIRPCFDEAEDDLNAGDPANGIDIFPEDTRRILYINGITKLIRQTGAFIVGGSNFAQEMLKTGAFSEGDVKNTMEDGYHGTYGAVDMNLLSPMKIRIAEEYLGFPYGTLAASGFMAVESSGYANQFALADNGVKTIPAPQGQGTRLQPNYRMGAATFFTKGNVFIMQANYVNPFGIFGIISKTPTIIGKGSRLADLALTATATASTGKIVCAPTYTSYAQAGNPQTVSAAVAGFAYFQSDSAVTSLPAFVTGYTAASVKGLSTSATISGLTLTAGKYANVIAYTAQGQISAVYSVLVA